MNIRAAFRLARAGLLVLSGVGIAATALPWLPEPARQRIKARWSRQMLRALGVRLVPHGTPPIGGLLVSNHVSWLDILAINALAPANLVSKDDVRHWPVIGWLSAQAGTLFIERGSRLAAQRTREHLVGELRGGGRVGVFPEGTTSCGDHVLPFHGALFQSAIDAGAPVAPVMLRYTDASGQPTMVAAYVGEISFWESVRTIVASDGLTVRVMFLSALDSTASDRRHLAHHSHQLIAHALAAAITPSHPAPLGAHKAVERPAGPRAAPPSDTPPKDSRSPAPGDSSRA
jgi:1-acyl-sn-glycerol-3-phosphate acyltransferase